MIIFCIIGIILGFIIGYVFAKRPRYMKQVSKKDGAVQIQIQEIKRN